MSASIEPQPPTQVDQLRRINRYLRSAINQIEEAVVIIGPVPLEAPGPRIYFANKAAAEMTGILESDLVGSPIGAIYEKNRLPELLGKLPLVAKRRRTFQTEKTLHRVDGQKLVCRWTISSLVDLDGKPLHYVLTFRQMRGEDLLLNSGGERGDGALNAFLERSRVESLAMVTVGVAHDFNNVLTTIQANLSMARLATSVDDRARKPIEDAAMAAESAQALSNQLLTFAKGSSPQRKNADLGQLLRRAVRLALVGSSVSCDIQIANDLQGAKVEETQILQVFHNLLTNSRQAMSSGGTIRVNCENQSVDPDSNLHVQPGDYVVITVRDRGCGIAEENLSKVFDPFFTTKETGTGMGLATCFLVIQRHKGTITVRSKVNVGTEFSIYLPASGPRLESKDRVEQDMVIPGDGSVLVVDDHDGVRSVAVGILQALGYDVIPALSGEEALRVYATRLNMGQPVAAVLMDMTLPGGMSGDDAVQEIRRLDPSARTIATSGYFDEGMVDRLLEEGYAAILPKPYTAEKLSAVLSAALSS